MKGYLAAVVILAALAPVTADAAWWNFFSKKAQKPAQETVATTTESSLDLSDIPTIGDLNKRIAELEDKLQKALSENSVLKLKAQFVETAQAEKKTEPAAQKTAALDTGASEKQILAKIKPALVSIETATTSASGAIIDSAGHIIVPAHAIWIEKADKTVIGILDQVSITLSSGSKKKALVVGMDESRDFAVLKISDKGSYPYIELGVQSAAKQGDKAYVAGVPGTKGGTGGEPFLAGSISKTAVGGIEVAIDKKPLDNGGAIIDTNGNFIGIPNKSTCKVLEEMKTCLKYSVTSDSIKATLSQVMDGMILYKEKQNRTKFEELVRGQLEGVYQNTKNGGPVEYAVTSVSGENSFDNFNKRLVDDQKGKITRLYLSKLMVAAGNIYSAFDVLENQADALRVFLINEEASIADLGSYQKKVLADIQSYNMAKLKEYGEKAKLWSKKKNEYDAYLTDPSKINHDYLMTEGVFVEEAAEYLKAERGRILDMFSGESVDIF